MSERKATDFNAPGYREFAGNLKESIEVELSELEKKEFAQRIFSSDHTLWGDDPTEISNRLGWLSLPKQMLSAVEEIYSFSESVRKKGFTDVVVLGMGGSSLSSEVFRSVFPASHGFMRLALVDTTDPDFILRASRSLDLQKTLFIVSSKSGSTVETISLMKYFYRELEKITDSAGKHFVCITDPGSMLADTARNHNFAKVFINDPNVGGRFSVLSYFGLVPASLTGIDIKKVLGLAAEVLYDLKKVPKEGRLRENTSFRLGTFLGVAARAGKDKLGFVFSEKLFPFGYWVEQLIAESLGKNGVGILPLLDEPFSALSLRKKDRVYALFSLGVDEAVDAVAGSIEASGVPFVKIDLHEPMSVSAEFLRLEFAVAVAGSIMGINPFDQPDVESAKFFARSILNLYKETGRVEDIESDFFSDGLLFSSNINLESSQQLAQLVRLKTDGYISIQAYVDHGEENSKNLLSLRAEIERNSSVPVTLGFGPRFLHSTGQLHKGDSGRGFFIQIVSRNATDLSIPADEVGSQSSSFSFEILKVAQARGDFRSLDEKGRDVVRIGISPEVSSDVQKIREFFNTT